MHDSIDPNLATPSEPSTVEDRGPGRNEDFVFNSAANNVGVRPDQAVVADPERVTSVAAKDGVLHHDAFGSDGDRTTLGNDLRTEENSATRADDDVAAYGRVWRHIRAGVDPRRFALMVDEHRQIPRK